MESIPDDKAGLDRQTRAKGKTRPPPPVRVAPLVPVAMAVVAGVVADRYGEPWGTTAWAGLAAGFAALAVLGVRRRWVWEVAVLGAWGALAGGWHHYRWSDVAGDDLYRGVTESPRPVWLRGVIRDVQGYRPGRLAGDKGVTRAVFEVGQVRGAEDWRGASGRAVLTVGGDRTDLRAGDAVEAAGGLARLARPLNPGEFDFRTHMRAEGVRLRLAVDDPEGVWPDRDASGGPHGPSRRAGRWVGAVRAWGQTRLTRGLAPRTAPLASALLLGRREGVDPDVNDAFARTGTTHLLAISGLHMQVLALALGGALRLVRVGRRAGFAAVLAATVAYALLVGLMPSVVRSAAMTVTYCLAGWADRKARAANTLAVAAILTLGLNPAHLFDVGCQLSFLAVAAIVWVSGPVAGWVAPSRHPDPLTAVERRFEPGWKGRGRQAGAWVVKGLILSTVVWLAALPLVALRFHIVSPIGVVLNLPLIPITSLALLASGVSLGLSAVWEPLGWPAARVCSVLLGWTESIVRWGVSRRWGHAFVAGPSWGWVLIFYAALGLATAAAVGRRPGRWVAAGLLTAWTVVGLGLAVAPEAFARPDDPPKGEVLAVGHGLAVVIETGGGRAVLYDCGRIRDPSVGRRVIAPALWARGVRRLDAVVLSHADADHYDGLPDLLDRIPVAVVLVPEGFAGPANPGAAALLDLVRSRGVAVRTVAAGAAWSAGATRFAVRHPPAGWKPEALDNARSVVLDVAWGGRHALLTGDLDGPGLAALLARSSDGPVDLMLAPHHGSRAANPASLYAWARPARVVVSQRPPMPGARDPLAPLDTPTNPVLRTWQRGAVRLTWTPGGITTRGFLDEGR